ncbi:MAG: diaminopimelate epimerase [Bdellovibrionaceae bacterium]|nr:diaminopimelate epimerase [Pseudobdellovibrionaceae bacterium]MBX3033691.1 diaminopimelate epimerase [Pseudobdellovibrionaceae bacterium]
MKSKGTFVTMSGAGNTFAVFQAVGHEGDLPAPESRRAFVAPLCRNLAVDGVLFIEAGRDQADYTWDFYNADGSSAEMCGNAARCAGLFCREVIRDPRPSYRFLTGAGPVTVEGLADGRWRVEMTEIKNPPAQKTLRLLDKDHQGFAVNTGVPHFVIPVENLGDLPASVCRALRQHPEWGPAGSNITLLQKESATRARAKTYERGVEDFTAACGTGAVAAALVLQNEHGRQGPVLIRMPGGDLEVDTASPAPRLTGPARITKEHPLTEETFQ